MLSICCASHNPKHLRPLAASISTQTRKDWELIVLTNGYLSPDTVRCVVQPMFSASDWKKVRIVAANSDTPRTIGAVKREAFRHAKGEIIVEVDHDDLLLPECLAEVHDAFEESGADFVYSNMAPFYDDNWEGTGIWFPTVPTRPLRVFGRILYEGITEPVTPHLFYQSGMASIFHVRAWRRSFYEKIGGHDPQYAFADDYDLVIRTYLADAKFHHIDRCLYLYRVERPHDAIQASITLDPMLCRRETDTFRSKYIVPVLQRWCRDNKLNFVSHPDLFGFDGENAGAIVVSSQFARIPVTDLLRKAHRQLVHGGWLLTTEPMAWSMSDVMKFTRPKHRPVERFQELLIRDSWFGKPISELRKVTGERRITVHVAAKKKNVPLGGPDYWHPRVNETDLRFLKSTFESFGCTIRYEGEYFHVSGPPFKLDMALRSAENISPIYGAGTIRVERDLDGPDDESEESSDFTDREARARAV